MRIPVVLSRALEKSTLRPNELRFPILLSGFPEAVGIPGLLDALGLDAKEEFVAKEKIDS